MNVITMTIAATSVTVTASLSSSRVVSGGFDSCLLCTDEAEDACHVLLSRQKCESLSARRHAKNCERFQFNALKTTTATKQTNSVTKDHATTVKSSWLKYHIVHTCMKYT